jgi:hypothetical protein
MFMRSPFENRLCPRPVVAGGRGASSGRARPFGA